MAREIKETAPVEYRLTIKDMPQEIRPRERMLASGVQALSNTELLAILLRTGNPGETALGVAARILSGPGGLRYLAEATLDDLKGVKGVGLAKAAQVKAAVELGRRVAAARGEERPVIKSPSDVANLVMEEMRYLDREHFRALSLNNKNRVLAVDSISVGGLSSSLVHPREVFKNSIKRSAAAVVLVHNHPSGDPSPSREDVEVTVRLMEAGKILGIEVLDHVVIGDNRYTSLKEKGMF
ncbi:DNA repair protein RadC [Clostridiales bacterium PH28_bin88]|nr:DNA repair protein RadC [Clostridiales bacterium PH28_bin88]